MKASRISWAAIVLVLGAGCARAVPPEAQGAAMARTESTHPPTYPQSAPMNAQERQNLDWVLDWWREVIEGGHLELTPKYQAEDYIQHNPNVNTGRAGFIEFFRRFAKPKDPIPAKLSNPPVVMGARGDYVWLIFEHQGKDPRDASKVYRYNSFDVLRIQNGKVQEHWDSDQKLPGSGKVTTGDSPRPPMAWNTGELSNEEQKTLALGTEELAWIRPPVLTLVDGPYCLFMWDRMARDPDDPSREYKWDHFDVVRVENGLVKEHWDEARLEPPEAERKQ